jgi:FAD/FMN-containing dehydrogenase
VLELQVVTGRGKLVTCSDQRNSDLFNAALGGMGQCSLIVEATLELVPAFTHVRLFVLSYPDLETLTTDLRTLVNDGRFDHLDGRTTPLKGGGFTYDLEAGAFYNGPKAPGDAQLLAGLSFASQAAWTMTYVEYYRRLPSLSPRAPRPWLFLCLPASRFLEYAKRVYATPAEFAYSAPRFSAWKRSSIKRPLTRIPNEDLVMRFQCSRSPPAAEVPTVIAMNRTLYERARDIGGTHVTTGAIPFSQADWIHHYGPAWAPFLDAKRQFDPDNVLTPGPGIFPG